MDTFFVFQSQVSSNDSMRIELQLDFKISMSFYFIPMDYFDVFVVAFLLKQL